MKEQTYSYAPIAASDQSTVVAEYLPDALFAAEGFQSEAQLEASFIALLMGQAYEYLPITTEAELIANLRKQLAALNQVTFSESEWNRFFTESLAKSSDSIQDKTQRIQEGDSVQQFRRDAGSTQNITLIDKKNIHNNRLQVINQYETAGGEGGARDNRYDVTVLVNGLPMVHIELKRRGVDIREAFNQISRYQRDSFFAGSGLFNYVQIFVISNGTRTKYYSNTTRRQHIEALSGKPRQRASSNSFEFTSYWADATNRPILPLEGFTKTFFAKHTLLALLTRYCVFTQEKQLLVMRPYQIVATERILNIIAISKNSKTLGTVNAGGYIWHTTGSGKTLTSFKTAQLASAIEGVGKVLFVVDRKDLDYQTMLEYERFQKDAANSSKSTAELKRHLEDPSKKIIVTTIQKLATFIAAHRSHEVYRGHIVIIFDECHRSQFGDMHTAITKAFKRYNLFGFTGTPIFAVNSGNGAGPVLRTTEQVFGEKLHTYTIVDAITDKNVLPFRIDYINTLKLPPGVSHEKVYGIDTERALLAPERISQIVAYILQHFDHKTRRRDRKTGLEERYEQRVLANISEVIIGRGKVHTKKENRSFRGFNSLFATASIDAAKRYYAEFKAQQAALPPDRRLKVGLIFSFAPNEAEGDGHLAEEGFEPEELDQSARDFLDNAIADYNAMFCTAYDTSADKFQNFYKDMSLRLKNRELDLVIVVNMFLTGFDATTLNTLWVDKNLRSHGLIQAYSRTNRILNSVKTYGNIVSFRNLEQATNEAIVLFGNKDAKGTVLLKPFAEYHDSYLGKNEQLLRVYPLSAFPIASEGEQKKYIILFGEILRLRNILAAFDEFDPFEKISEGQFSDYQSHYLDLHAEFRKLKDGDKDSINDDVVFELELIKQVEITVDYILLLVAKYKAERGDGKDKEIMAEIRRAIDASPRLRDKKDLIEAFVAKLSTSENIDEQWLIFVENRRAAELDTIIAEEHLKAEETRSFMDAAFRGGEIPQTGTAITTILPPTTRFARKGGHAEIKQRVLQKLKALFDRFFGLVTERLLE